VEAGDHPNGWEVTVYSTAHITTFTGDTAIAHWADLSGTAMGADAGASNTLPFRSGDVIKIKNGTAADAIEWYKCKADKGQECREAMPTTAAQTAWEVVADAAPYTADAMVTLPSANAYTAQCIKYVADSTVDYTAKSCTEAVGETFVDVFACVNSAGCATAPAPGADWHLMRTKGIAKAAEQMKKRAAYPWVEGEVYLSGDYAYIDENLWQCAEGQSMECGFYDPGWPESSFVWTPSTDVPDK